MSRFDEIIQQKVNNHRAPTPPGAWDNIINKKKKKRNFFFWWIAALLLSGIAVGYYHHRNVINEPGKKETVRMKPVDKVDKVNDVAGNTIADRVNKVDGVDGINGINNVDEVDKVKTIDKTGANEKVNTVNNVEKDHSNLLVRDKTKAAHNINENRLGLNEIVRANQNAHATHTIKNKKKKTGTDGKIVPVEETIVKSSDDNGMDVLKNKTKENKRNNDLSADNKIVVKTKEKSRVKIESVETEKEIDNSKGKINEPVTTDDETIAKNDTKKELNEQTDLQSALKKNITTDSVQKKLIATPADENKKQKTAVNKSAQKHAWFIDMAVSPVFPIQQYDRSITFNRTQTLTGGSSVFLGKLENTSIDPSLAFSIHIRKEISKKIMIGLGAQYLQLKEHIDISGTETNTKYEIVDRLVNYGGIPQLISDTVKIIKEGNRTINAINSYRFISIPFFIQYDFLQKSSWSLGVVAGGYLNMYSKYENEINRDAAAELVTSSQVNNEENNIGLALFGGLRFGKTISNKLSLFAMPSYTGAVGRQNIKNNLLNKKIQQAGVMVGLSYKIK